MIIKAKRIMDDSWGRKRIKNLDNNSVYVDVDGVWHTSSKDGEPDCPLRSDIEFEIDGELSPSKSYMDDVNKWWGDEE